MTGYETPCSQWARLAPWCVNSFLEFRKGKQKIYNRFSKSDAADKGIKVHGNGDSISVEIHIVVTYGININAIAVSITEKVKHIVMEATGLEVEKVTVKIDGIQE